MLIPAQELYPNLNGFRIPHSVLNDFTGFDVAALTA